MKYRIAVLGAFILMSCTPEQLNPIFLKLSDKETGESANRPVTTNRPVIKSSGLNFDEAKEKIRDYLKKNDNLELTGINRMMFGISVEDRNKIIANTGYNVKPRTGGNPEARELEFDFVYTDAGWEISTTYRAYGWEKLSGIYDGYQWQEVFKANSSLTSTDAEAKIRDYLKKNDNLELTGINRMMFGMAVDNPGKIVANTSYSVKDSNSSVPEARELEFDFVYTDAGWEISTTYRAYGWEKLSGIYDGYQWQEVLKVNNSLTSSDAAAKIRNYLKKNDNLELTGVKRMMFGMAVDNPGKIVVNTSYSVKDSNSSVPEARELEFDFVHTDAGWEISTTYRAYGWEKLSGTYDGYVWKSVSVAFSSNIFAKQPASNSMDESVPDSEQEGSLIGDWKNEDPNTSGITRFQIYTNNGSIAVRAWGKCHPTDCDWKEQMASSSTDKSLNILYDPGFKETTLLVTLLADGRLKIDSQTHFKDDSGRADYQDNYFFRRNGSLIKSASPIPLESASPSKNVVTPSDRAIPIPSPTLTPSAASTHKSINVEPEEFDVTVGASFSVIQVNVTLADGSIGVLTNRTAATWASADTTVVTIGTNGVMDAIAVGSTTITVTYKGLSKTVPVTVKAAN